jgi:putative oxidoreductase
MAHAVGFRWCRRISPSAAYYRAKLRAWLLVVFLIPVALMMHDFWSIKDPMMAQMQMVMLMENVSMLDGARFIS